MTVAGSSERGKEDGQGGRARFNERALAPDERGRLLVADFQNSNIHASGGGGAGGGRASQKAAVYRRQVLMERAILSHAQAGLSANHT